MHIFMTGVTGYIGNEVARALLNHAHTLTVLVRTQKDAERLQALGYRPVIGDMHFPKAWQAEAAAADALIHTAQVRAGQRGDETWVRAAQEADTVAFRGMMEAARTGRRCRALIYTSGVAVVGDHGEAWVDEHTPPAPGAIGRYHLAGEQLVKEARQQGLPALALRPGLPYGLGGTFEAFFLAEAAKRNFIYVGDGENFQPTVHLADLAQAYTLALEKCPAGEVINLVDDEPLRMRELGKILLDAFAGGKVIGVPLEAFAHQAGGAVAETAAGSYRARNAKAKALLGWQPRFPTFREGIKDIIAEYKRRNHR